MNNCNTSPLFIPTTVIANVKNIDAVDVSATNISCDTLSVAGEPISNIWQNVTNTSVGFTQFTGNVEITDILDVSTRIVTPTLQSQTVTTGTLSATSISNTGSLTVSGASALQALSTTSFTCTGDMTVDTTTLKVDSTGNKVGINTTAAPSEALDVVGNIKGSGTLTVAGNVTVDTTTLVVNASSNRVGVNVAVPSEALDVSGNIKGSGTLAVTGNGTVGGTLGVTGDLTVDTDALKVIASTNRVGINTTAPTDTLDVNGTTSLRGNTIVGSAALKVSTADNRVGVNTLNPTETLDVTGNIKGSGTLAIAGNSTVGGTLGVTGQSTLSALTVTGNGTVGGTLGVTGALTANYFSPYTYSTVSANASALNFTVTTSTSATRIELFLYGVGLASNSYFAFRVGTDSATILQTTIYDYTTSNNDYAPPEFAESGDSRTLIRCCNDLSNNEYITGSITLIKQAAAQGASAGWTVDGVLRASQHCQNVITGFIRHTGNIGAVRFESASGNFNKTNSYVRSASTREF